jgi:polar amino acid transport system substrate-binding protein
MRMIGIVVALVLVWAGAAAQAGERLRCVYASGEAPPFQLGEGEAVPREHPGMSVELMQMAAAALDIDLELARLPNRRVVPAVARNDSDCAFALSFLPERAATIAYPMRNGRLDRDRRIGSSTYVVYRRAGSPVSWDGKRFSDLGEGAIGINAGFAARDELVRMGVPVEEADSTVSNMRKLAARRIAAYVVHAAIGDDYLARVPQSGIEKLDIPFQEKDYYVVLSPKFVGDNPELAERLWDRLGALRIQHGPDMLKRYLATVN